jgi:hypothetical protein
VAVGLACYANGCTQPVSGQCGGYKGNCGQFYCRTHSKNKYCAECANQKAADEAEVIRQERIRQQAAKVSQQKKAERASLERVYQHYVAVARAYRSENKYACAPFLILLVGVFPVLIASAALARTADGGSNSEIVFFPTAGYIVLAFVTWLVLLRKTIKNHREGARKFDVQKPGFSRFYLAWLDAEAKRLTEERREYLKNMLPPQGQDG